MKKKIKIYALMVMLLLVLTACGRKETPGTSDVTTGGSVSEETGSTDSETSGENVTQGQSTQENDTQTQPVGTQPTETQSEGETNVQETTMETTIGEAVSEEQATGETNQVGTLSGTPYELHGKLAVSGVNLVDEKGEAFQLRGVSTHGLTWYSQYVNFDTFKQLRDDWGANAVRLAMYTAEGGYCESSEAGKQAFLDIIDTGVQAAAELGMYVIIDWHILKDNNPLTNADAAADFFDKVSSEYKDYGNVIYEICNEPNGGTSWADIKAYAERIIPIIKNNNPDAVIIVGTPTWSQDVEDVIDNAITGYSNIMYTFHFYADTHRGDFRNKLLYAYNRGIPIMVTEFGICDASGGGANNTSEGNAWIDTLDSCGISYFMWSLSNKAETASLISSSCQSLSGWSEGDLSEAGKWYRGILRERRDSTVDIYVSPVEKAEEATKEQADVSSTPSEKNCVVTLSKSNGWESENRIFVQLGVVLSNNSDVKVDGWCIEITFDQNVSMSEAWCCNYEVDGNVIRLTPVDYNPVIEANSSRTEIGFIISAESYPVIEKAEVK